ncbi:Metallo-hydrolase/oxidoreductase [Lactifluus subvellereus]|nr:Metallo-hydrolase/oxidoreductase [Lactifluus subvellereus]
MIILSRQLSVTVRRSAPQLALRWRTFHSTVCSRASMRVIPVPVRKDNYSYLLIDVTSAEAAAVDPYTPSKVKAAAEQLGVKIVAGITTHHHHDHSGGNEEFAQLFPGVPIYAGSHRSPAVTQLVKGNDEFTIGKALKVRCLATPCHTQDSICYYATDTSAASPSASEPPEPRAGAGVVFTGDTLFIAGCGVFFEGDGEQMHAAFELLRTLPDETVTYVGHEYTAANLEFALSVDPRNAALARLGELVRAQAVTVGCSTIGDEKGWNVFWRLSSDPVRTATKTGPDASPNEVIDKLRTLKNNFKG